MNVKLLLVLAVVAVVVAEVLDCPANCSGKGTCSSSGQCNCNQYYTGLDCSIYERSIHADQTLTNNIGNHEWQFYSMDIPRGSAEFTVEVVQDTPGDADLYVKQGDYPRRDSYDGVDLGRNDEFSVMIEDPEAGIWYAGVYGFFGCEYHITLTVLNGDTCPNSCSGHGDCSDGVCTCRNGYTGEDCSNEILTLESGHTYHEEIGQSQWKYYQVVITNQNELQFVVNETSADGDSDIYVLKGSLPSLWEFDYRDSSISSNYALTIDGVSQGTYYVGIFGYRQTSLDLVARYGALEVCDNKCSNHGDCSGTTCQCYPDYGGESCETLLPAMDLDDWYAGFVRDNSWNYYHVAPSSADNLVLSVRQNADGDCDLYVRSGDIPTRFDYDARDVSFDMQFDLTIENPQDQVWYIGVFGYQECEYSIRAHTSATACPNSCSHHGNCIAGGRCDCNSGWAGIDCASPLHHLSNGIPRTDDVVYNNQWQYYKFEVVRDSSYLTVELRETSTSGYLWLYVNQGAPPTLSDYQHSNTDMDTASHSVAFRTNAMNQDANYYIGVYGSPLSSVSSRISYTIIAYSPPI